MSRAKSSPVAPGQTPAEFLASGPDAMTPATPGSAPAPTAVATPPGEIQQFRAPITPQTAPEPIPEVPAGPVPVPSPAPSVPDPFTELHRWQIGENLRTLRVLQVPGGCVLRLSVLRGMPPGFQQIAESMCFVPDVVLKDGGVLALVDKQPVTTA